MDYLFLGNYTEFLASGRALGYGDTVHADEVSEADSDQRLLALLVPLEAPTDEAPPKAAPAPATDAPVTTDDSKETGADASGT